uniref:Uncharacterized protein n=1 Tax=Anopheles atroparvus TaxID=41427 RepID=A0A182JB50_ANOAO
MQMPRYGRNRQAVCSENVSEWGNLGWSKLAASPWSMVRGVKFHIYERFSSTFRTIAIEIGHGPGAGAAGRPVMPFARTNGANGVPEKLEMEFNARSSDEPFGWRWVRVSNRGPRAFRFGFPNPARLPPRLPPKVLRLLAFILFRPPPPPPPPAPPPPPRPWFWFLPPLFISARLRDFAWTSSFTMSITSSGMRRYLIVLPRM